MCSADPEPQTPSSMALSCLRDLRGNPPQDSLSQQTATTQLPAGRGPERRPVGCGSTWCTQGLGKPTGRGGDCGPSPCTSTFCSTEFKIPNSTFQVL